MTSTERDYSRLSWIRSWQRFWFESNDPTTLGFIRILVGFLVLYVHLAYIPDLQNFFGERAWWDHKTATWEREEFPWGVGQWDWNDRAEHPSIRLPDALNRRKAVMDFYHRIPVESAKREQAIAFLKRAVATNSPDEFRAAMDLMLQLAQSLPEDKNRHREAMLDLLFPSGSLQRQMSLNLPPFIRNQPSEERGKMIGEILEFGEILPEDLDELTFVIGYLQIAGRFMDGSQQLLSFVEKLPNDAAEKTRVLDYLNRWDADPRDTLTAFAQGRYTFSFFFHNFHPVTMHVFHCIGLVFIFLFAIGLFTRVSSVVTWFFCLQFIHRTSQVLFGMDSMMMILVTYLMLGDAGQALSIDRLRLRYRAARALAASGGTSVPWAEQILAGPSKTWTANFAIRLIQVHFCFIYASSGLSKLKGQMWWNHNAAWPTLANAEFCPLQFTAYEDLLRLVFQNQLSYAVISAGIVLFTLALEIGLPFLIWHIRLRPYIVIGSILLHTGIAIVMGLTLFGCLMLCLLLSYFPAALIRERMTYANAKGERLKLKFSPSDAGQLTVVGRLKALDVAGQVEMVPTTNASLTLMTERGESYEAADIPKEAYRRLVLLDNMWLLRIIPGFGIWIRSLLRQKAK